MILSITVKEITFWNGNLIYVIRNVPLTFDLKKIIRKHAQICDRCSLEYSVMLSRFHSRGRTHDAGSVTRIACLSINLRVFEQTFAKMISLSIILCLFIHNSRSKHSRNTTAQAPLQWDFGE